MHQVRCTPYRYMERVSVPGLREEGGAEGARPRRLAGTRRSATAKTPDHEVRGPAVR